MRKPLQVQLKNVGKVFMCITRLHTDITNTDEANDHSPVFVSYDVSITNIEGSTMGYHSGGNWEDHSTIKRKTALIKI